MLGKPEWFQPRKYLGWGVYPKTWQGWVYLLIALAILAIFQVMPFWSNTTRAYFTIVWAVVLIIDIADIMIRMKRDEREKIHEALSDRNALWIIIIALIAGVIYQMISSGLTQNVQIDWTIIIALILGLATKAITNIYLDRKD